MRRPRRPLLPAAVLCLASLAPAACGGPLLANPVPTARPVTPASPAPARSADPQPLAFPRDDGPHDRLTEWWYYTGHLRADDGRRFGFEAVVFRAERGSFPVTWASHVAVTDESGDRFLYDQRSEVGPQVDRSRPGGGFDLAMVGQLQPGMPRAARDAWILEGSGGRDRVLVQDARSGGDVGFGLDLSLDAGDRQPVAHDGDGYVDFGPAGGSYYYSRTRMEAEGTLELEGQLVPVTGSAWFDHQWGDFISVGGGGWDWFAINLEDGTDVTLSLVRAADGSYPLVYGTLVGPDGTVRHLDEGDFEVAVTATWTSEATGATWPAGWRVRLPEDGLVVDLEPTVAEQELDTRATTGVVYWEGSQRVRATRDGRPLGGEAYVELTGYWDGSTPAAAPLAAPAASPGSAAPAGPAPSAGPVPSAVAAASPASAASPDAAASPGPAASPGSVASPRPAASRDE